MAKLGFPVVCYNLTDKNTGERLYPAHVMLQRDNVRMAVVGITDIGASQRQPPDEWRGMDTTKMNGLREYVQNLRRLEKPDLVIALTHTGLTIARNIAREMPEFDVVLSGHTHERTAWPIMEGKVIVVEPGAFGSWLGRLDLILKPGGGIAAQNSSSFRFWRIITPRMQRSRSWWARYSNPIENAWLVKSARPTQF